MQLERLAVQRRRDGGDQRPRPVRGEDARRVLHVGPVDVRAVRVLRPRSRRRTRRRARRTRVGERRDDLGAAPPAFLTIRAVSRTASMSCVGSSTTNRSIPCVDQARVDELDHLGMRPLPGDEPEPGADELQPRVRHRRAGQPQQVPRVLPVRPHRHAHRGARRVVQRPEPDPFEHRRDRRDVRGAQPGRPPQRLVPVAQRHVDQLKLSHDSPERTRLTPGTCRDTPYPRRPSANSVSASSAAMHVQVGHHPVDGAPVQGAAQRRERLAAVRAVPDDLGEQRVVVRRHRRAGLEVRVDPDPGARGEHRAGDRPRAGQEVPAGVLGVDPALDRVPGERDVLLRSAQRPALGDRDLLGDDVEAGDRLGDRVLDLDAGVDLEEVELLAFRVDEELDRARAPVAQVLAERDRRARAAVPAGPSSSRGAGASSMSFW